MVFQYYIPGGSQSTVEAIEKAGIKGVFDKDTPYMPVPVIGGPDDKNGLLVALDVDGAPHPGYYPDRQKWVNVGTYWVGWFTSSPPDPEKLLRSDVLMGHHVKLTDGQNWIVPMARHFFPADGSPIPRVFAYDSEGREIEKPDPRYAEFCKGADDRWYWFVKETGEAEQNQYPDEASFMLDLIEDMDEPERPDDKARFTYCANALVLNYRATRRDMRAAELIDTEVLRKMEAAIFDWVTVEALSEAATKKKSQFTPDGSDIDGGPQES